MNTKDTMTLKDGRECHVVRTYAEATEVLRRWRDFSAHGARGDLAQEFIGATVIDLDGSNHAARRRLLGPLIQEDQMLNHVAFIVERLLPARLAGIEEDSTFDLIPLLHHIFWTLAVRLVGLDIATDVAELEELRRVVEPAVQAELGLFSNVDDATLRESGNSAVELYRREYFDASVERRRLMTSERRPTDLISLMLEGHPDDDDLICRESIVFIGGTVSNPVALTAHALAELDRWVSTVPADRERIVDASFLDAVIAETIRLHRTGNPYLARKAVTDVTLRATGRHFESGEWVAIDIPAVNRDPEVFGVDAHEFQPHRVVDHGVAKTYAMGFGGGPHACLGKPFIVGDGRGTDRLQALVVAALVNEGIVPDSEKPPIREEHGGERFLSFPVRRRLPSHIADSSS